MKRSLLVGALALVCATAYAQNFNTTGSMSGIPNSGEKWEPPSTPAGHVVATGVRSLFALELYSKASTGVWLKIYDTASTPTCGSGTPVKKIAIPAASTPANLTGNNVIFGLTGFNLNNGLAYCVTGDFADNDTTSITASTIVVNTDYR